MQCPCLYGLADSYNIVSKHNECFNYPLISHHAARRRHCRPRIISRLKLPVGVGVQHVETTFRTAATDGDKN